MTITIRLNNDGTGLTATTSYGNDLEISPDMLGIADLMMLARREHERTTRPIRPRQDWASIHRVLTDYERLNGEGNGKIEKEKIKHFSKTGKQHIDLDELMKQPPSAAPRMKQGTKR